MSFENLPAISENHGADLTFKAIINYRENHGLTTPRPNPEFTPEQTADFVVGQNEATYE